MKTVPRHSLTVRELQLQVHLGCTAEERLHAQEVRVGVELRFFSTPAGTVSDDLRDTICYARLSTALREHVSGREFQLVEKMGQDFYSIIHGMVEGRAEIGVTVHKVRPPIEGLIGGVEYRVDDFG